MDGPSLFRRAFVASLCLSSSIPAHAATRSDLPQYTVSKHIAGRDGGWDFANIDPTLNRLFVARTDAVMAIDLASGKVTDRLAAAQGAHQVLVLKGGQEILETDGATNLARFIDGRTGLVKAEVTVGAKPDAALLDPVTGLVAVMNSDDGTVSLLDPRTRTLVGSINVGGGLEFGIADGRGSLFINIEDRNEIAVVDMKTRSVSRRIPLTGCEGPTGIAMVAGGTRLISACANGIAAVVDPVAGKVTETLAIGGDPDAVLYDARRGLAFIPCGHEGVLEVIAAAKPEAIRHLGRISTAISAKTAALDPRTGKIYLPSAQLFPPAPGAKRGKPKPGTFEVLVLSPTNTPISSRN
jgi:DNA-binding beta-propeller fold protein YncE